MTAIETRYKLLALDVDGTLLSKHGTISAEDEKAIALASALGIRISLSSGRAASACLPIIDQLSLDGYHTFFDGALVSNLKLNQEIYAAPINDRLVGQITEFIHHNEINLELFSTNRFFIERETWTADIRRQFFGLQPVIVDFTDLERKERIIKGTLLTRSAEEKAKAELFCRHFARHLSFSWTKTPAYPEIDFINVLAPGVSKGKALETLALFLGIPLAGVMAIGDGANDASVFARVGLAVAMADAPDELKAVAHHITLDVDHNGVATAISKFLL